MASTERAPRWRRQSVKPPVQTGRIQGPVVKGALEFQTSARDVFEIIAEHADADGFCDRSSGLVDALVVYEDAAGEDESLSALARGGEAEVYEVFVESFFQGQAHLRELHAERTGMFGARMDWLARCLRVPHGERWATAKT